MTQNGLLLYPTVIVSCSVLELWLGTGLQQAMEGPELHLIPGGCSNLGFFCVDLDANCGCTLWAASMASASNICFNNASCCNLLRCDIQSKRARLGLDLQCILIINVTRTLLQQWNSATIKQLIYEQG